ncbi:hypothetical protein OH77DRAFT_533720 [Trametes cingulata]|nr:hypothetical protein OH77DRAFT_533720 [Trametes cingulata]
MAEPHRSSNTALSSSSHKRSYDAIGPETEAGQTDLQHPRRSRGDSPQRSPSSGEGSRERSKRARPDSGSSYTSEVDDILLSTTASVSPSSSSGSSQSSYHSAQSTLPGLVSPPLLDAAEDDMLVDPVEPDPRPASPVGGMSSFLDTVLPRPTRRIPAPPSASSVPQRTASEPFEENFARFLERASAFDREIAQLRSSPAGLPTSSSRSAGPLPPLESPPGLDDDFLIPDVYAEVLHERHSDRHDVDEFEALHIPTTNTLAERARARVHGPPFGLGRRSEHVLVSADDEDMDRRAPPRARRGSHAELDVRARSPDSRFTDGYTEASAASRAGLPSHLSNSSQARQRPPLRSPPMTPVMRDIHRSEISHEWSASDLEIPGPREGPAIDQDVYYDAGRDSVRRNWSDDLQPIRSLRNASAIPSRLPLLPEHRAGGSLRSIPRSVSQHVSDYTASQPRSSPWFPTPMASDASRGLLDDPPWTRAGDFDRTLREVEAHRRRMAEFLAEPLPPLPSYVGEPDLSIPTSSYSTLRHALDDTVTLDTSRRADTSVTETTRPSTLHDDSSTLSFARFLSGEDDSDDAPPFSSRHERHPNFLSDGEFSALDHPPHNPYHLPALRRGPYRIRHAGESISARNDTSPWSRLATRESPPRALEAASYLEANSHARAINLSGLRHRARARSPPRPTSPPPSPPPRRAVSNHHTWTRNESPSRYTAPNGYYPPPTDRLPSTGQPQLLQLVLQRMILEMTAMSTSISTSTPIETGLSELRLLGLSLYKTALYTITDKHNTRRATVDPRAKFTRG